MWRGAAGLLCVVLGAFGVSPAGAQCSVGAAKDLLPRDGLVVTNPPSFSWSPGRNANSSFIQVSRDPSFEKINVVRARDDGSHYWIGSEDKFKKLSGETLYWRIMSVGCGNQRNESQVQSFTLGDWSVDPAYFIKQIPHLRGADAWKVARPSTVTVDTPSTYAGDVGTVGTTHQRRFGVSGLIAYFMKNDRDAELEYLERAFDVAEQTGVPLMIGLDGMQWWGARKDLWNHWDPSMEGYNPDNRHNVEWTGWKPSKAVKQGWRNWGSPVVIKAPHPNLASPDVIEANLQALDVLVPAIADWYRSLPANKKWLFAGVRIGWETNIGMSYFYPVNDAACRAGSCNNKQGQQIGYAAAVTAGLANGGKLTSAHLTKVVRDYVATLTRETVRMGIPRRKVYTHLIGHEVTSTRKGPVAAKTSFVPWANPGFSNYTSGAGASGTRNLDDLLESRNGGNLWGIMEWGLPGNGSWTQTLNGFSKLGNMKVINAFKTWDLVNKKAVRAWLGQKSCWMHPPVLSWTESGGELALRWSTPSQARQVVVRVSRSTLPDNAGRFRDALVELSVPNSNTVVLPDLEANPNELFAQVQVKGCGGRMLLSDTVKFAPTAATDEGTRGTRGTPGQTDVERGASLGFSEGPQVVVGGCSVHPGRVHHGRVRHRPPNGLAWLACVALAVVLRRRTMRWENR